MIQRIQSVYLFGASILASLFAFLNEHSLVFMEKMGVGFVSPTIVAILVAVLSCGIIFLYKNRVLQMNLTLVTFVIAFVAIVLYAIMDGIAIFYLDWEFYLLPLVGLVLLLARKQIKADEKLVRSADRLR